LVLPRASCYTITEGLHPVPHSVQIVQRGCRFGSAQQIQDENEHFNGALEQRRSLPFILAPVPLVRHGSKAVSAVLPFSIREAHTKRYKSDEALS
jgi:hypothetical protein